MKGIVFLQFWLLAGDLFDLRQAKRLFPVLLGFSLVGGVAASIVASCFRDGFRPKRSSRRPGILLLAAIVPVRMVGTDLHRRRPAVPRAHGLSDVWKGLRGDVEFSFRTPLLRTISSFILLLALALASARLPPRQSRPPRVHDRRWRRRARLAHAVLRDPERGDRGRWGPGPTPARQSSRLERRGDPGRACRAPHLSRRLRRRRLRVARGTGPDGVPLLRDPRGLESRPESAPDLPGAHHRPISFTTRLPTIDGDGPRPSRKR